ncbi:MAG: MHYT domain-containing protein [Gammaproteobacteria bacterium]|nr:MHYT domain-containing protein [Gammaproteobacteria bacterium]
MMLSIFQRLPIPADQLVGSYDIRIVALSIIVAISASYIALDLTGRLRDISNTPKATLLWLIGGAIAMGSGIWSMHFIGMLSFSIPGLTLHYDKWWTILSLFLVIIASGFALNLLKATIIRIEHYILGGIILGLAIASMHYMGMEALLISLNIRYLPALFFISILIAIVASEAALFFALKSNQVVLNARAKIKMISSIIMGIAISGMHYTGMAASIFTPLCAPAISNQAGTDPTYLSIGVALVTFVILGVAFLASNYKEALNQQQYEKARQLGMAEISTSVLHNVGNVLNSVNVSTSLIAEKMASSKLKGLEDLSQLFNDNKQDLAALIRDGRAEKAIAYLAMLAKYWREEQDQISSEISRLNTNLTLIKETISTQQELSKITAFQQIISVNALLDEALLITGLTVRKEILIQKHYGNIASISADKVKLLQVFVNLLQNAKDAVMENTIPEKIIILKTSKINKNWIQIEISDNGIGILSKNIVKVFSYGFTTKLSGHGFGLHASALSINALGGEMRVTSEGLGKGATFVIELPTNKV